MSCRRFDIQTALDSDDLPSLDYIARIQEEVGKTPGADTDSVVPAVQVESVGPAPVCDVGTLL